MEVLFVVKDVVDYILLMVGVGARLARARVHTACLGYSVLSDTNVALVHSLDYCVVVVLFSFSKVRCYASSAGFEGT